MKKAVECFINILAALALAFGVLLVPKASARAQSQAQPVSIRFVSLSAEDGLSQNTVQSVLQDSGGYMWFGTADGLNQYDGYTFTTYKHDPDNSQTLSDNSVLTIYEDTHKDLWFGTSLGLNRLDRRLNQFQRFVDDPDDPRSLSGSTVTAIAEDREGRLWVGTSEGGLNRMDRETNTFTHYLHDPHNLQSVASDSITALTIDPQGGMWVGTSAGLDYFDFNTQAFTHYTHNSKNAGSLSDNKVRSLHIDDQNTLWVGTEEGGLNRLNRKSGTFARFMNQPGDSTSLSGNRVTAIYEDSRARLWVGGSKALSQLDRQTNRFIQFRHDPDDPNSLASGSVLSLFEDHSGVLWIGTSTGGLSKYIQTNDRFLLYQHQPGMPYSLSEGQVNAIFEDDGGTVWVGTSEGGLNRKEPGGQSFYTYLNDPLDWQSLGSNDVRAIYEDHKNQLWVGTYGGGLNRLDRSTNKFTRFRFEPNNPYSLSDSRVLVIFEDSRQNLWIGTRGGGLNRYNPATLRFTRFQYNPDDPNSISGDYIHAIYEDRLGFLWIGTNTGISVMDPAKGTFQRFNNNPRVAFSLSSDRVLSFYEDVDGDVWIGTLLGGLNRFDRQTQLFEHFSEKDGLANDAVYAILPDQDGSLWMSTNKGLSVFNPSEQSFRNYDVRDGLQSNEFSPGAFYLNPQGQMYFGGAHGFNVFDPRSLRDNPVIPKIVITAFKKFNQVAQAGLSDGDQITLSYQENFISFEFAALDFSTPSKNQYAYKLEGFDRDWVYAGTRRYASYTNLKGGDYVFRVKGSNKDGVWNEVGTSVRIKVIPPVWEEVWFISSVGVFVAGAAVGLFYLRIRQVKNQQSRLEDQVRERTAEIARSANEIERRREVAEGLREILSILNSNQSLKDVLDSITQQAIHLMNAEGVIIFRCGERVSRPGDERTGAHCVVVTSTVPPGMPQPSTLFVAGWISDPLLMGQSRVVQDLPARRQEHPEWKGDLLQFGAVLAVPFMVNDLVDGGLVLAYQKPRNFSEEDLQTARSFADHAALAIANARLRSQAEELAVTAERNRLARDLHDAVTQTLFAANLIADVLPRLWDRNPDAARQKLGEIRELTRGALAEMRTLLMELRPAALEDVPLHDLVQQLSEAFIGRARVPVSLDLDRTIMMPPGVKIGFYRIAQEALNNISKHARASKVLIDLKRHGPVVEMQICDNGVGFDPRRVSPDHFGLGIMEERAQAVGASYALDSIPGEGTRITIRWHDGSSSYSDN